MGAAAPGEACHRDAAATVALVRPPVPCLSLTSNPNGSDSALGAGQGWVGGSVPRGLSCASSSLSSLQYHGNVTLESFSVLLAQVLGHSLGMSPDSPRGCSCPGRVCIMSPEAL